MAATVNELAVGAQAALLADGRRLHLNHGPMDLIVEAFGPPAEVEAAYRQARDRFATILDELVSELPALRRRYRATPASRCFAGPTARRMAAAVAPHAHRFVTPMAAVAGAVADEVLDALLAGRRLMRAYVNNGGDIALYLKRGGSLEAGVVALTDRIAALGRVRIEHTMPVRGIATSGRGGRSFSFGIAEAVTVLARDAAAADAAATLLGNAVDIRHPAIERRPAIELDPDSDLGARRVTVSVGPLDEASVARALDRGVAAAEAMCTANLLYGAVLALEGEVRVVGRGFPESLPRTAA